MYNIEEFDQQKTKVLKYILYKKRTESEIRTKFSKEMEENLLEDIIEYLKEAKYIDDKEYIRKTENIKQDGEIKGSRTRVKVVKNKVAPPFREAEFDIVYGEGISRAGNILDMAVNMDIIEKSGSWFSYDGDRIGQGRENVKKYLTDNPDMMAEIEKKVRDNFEKAFEQSLGEEIPEDDDDDVEE